MKYLHEQRQCHLKKQKNNVVNGVK